MNGTNENRTCNLLNVTSVINCGACIISALYPLDLLDTSNNCQAIPQLAFTNAKILLHDENFFLLSQAYVVVIYSCLLRVLTREK